MLNLIKLLLLATVMVVNCPAAYSAENSYSYDLALDKDFTSHSFADFSVSAIEGMRHFNAQSLDNNIFSTYLFGFLGIYITTLNHELGHYSVGKKYNLPFIELVINADTSGYTAFSRCPDHLHEEIELTLGGIHASDILASKLKLRYLENNKVYPLYGAGYINAYLDQYMYVMLSETKNNDGDDISCYVNELDKFYGNGDKSYISRNQLRPYVTLDLFDPFLYLSIYSFFGNENTDIPMLDLGFAKYLPAAKGVLAPFGPQYRLVNYFKAKDKIFTVELSYGNYKANKSYGVALKSNNCCKLTKDISIGGSIELWHQPELRRQPNAKNMLGGLVVISGNYNYNDGLDFFAQAGYKSQGFSIGRAIQETPLILAGLSLKF